MHTEDESEALFYVLQRHPQRWSLEDVSEIVWSTVSKDLRTETYVLKLVSGTKAWISVEGPPEDRLGPESKLTYFINPTEFRDGDDLEVDFQSMIAKLDQ